MNRIRLAAIAALLLGGQALGQSVMTFTLELGGDPKVADWEGFLETQYVPGSSANNQNFAAGSIVNWDVKVGVSGTHQTTPAGGPGHNTVPNGVANFVFTLELHQGTAGGPLVAVGAAPQVCDSGTVAGGDCTNNHPTGDGFFSTTNDGDGDGIRGIFIGPDPLTNAAFSRSFNGKIAGSGSGPGRVWDLLASGGPYLDRIQYPSAAGFPAGNTAPLGKLVGMGAGFSQYTRGGTETRTPGVGGSGSCAIQVVPVAEGQLKLANGTYTLVVVPGTGNNILSGAFNCATQAPGSFALAVNQAVGSSLTFTIGGGGGCTQVSLASAASRRTHGAAGAFDLAAPLTGAVREGRQAGSAPAMVLTFSGPPTNASGGALACSDFTITNGTCAGVTVSGNNAIVALSGLTKNTCLTVAATGVCLVPGSDNNVSVVLHEGQANTDTAVNILDLQAIKNVLNQALSQANFRSDINVNGTINILDLQACKNNLNQAAACP